MDLCSVFRGGVLYDRYVARSGKPASGQAPEAAPAAETAPQQAAQPAQAPVFSTSASRHRSDRQINPGRGAIGCRAAPGMQRQGVFDLKRTVTAGDRNGPGDAAVSRHAARLRRDRRESGSGLGRSRPARCRGLLIAMDHGAVEMSFAASAARESNSDTLLTPDFRILIGGPGAAEVKVRLGEKGDTCVDNAGGERAVRGGIERV